MSDASADMPALVEVGGTRVFELGQRTTIGRDPDNAICLVDAMVGRRHAEIVRQDGGYQLRDLGSRHGTFVAGQRVREVVLDDGDELLIAGTRLRFAADRSGVRAGGPIRIAADDRELVVCGRRPIGQEAGFRPLAEVADPGQLGEDYEKLRIAFELARAIGVEHEVGRLAERILAAAFELLPAGRGAVVLMDPDTRRPQTELARTRTRDDEPLILSTRLLDEVIEHRAGLITADAEIDERFSRSDSIAVQGIRSAMCVPMLYRDELLGVMYVDSRSAAGAFRERDLALFTTIASQAALAVKNALLAQRIQRVQAAEWQRLERVIARLPDGVVVLDRDRRAALINERGQEILPLLTTAGRGDRLDRLGSVTLDELVATGRRKREVVVPGPPRRVLVLSASARGGDDPTGEIVLVIREVTDERERDERASQQERLALLGRLSGGIAHDFNNLLSVILSYSEFAIGELPGGPLRDDLAEISGAAHRAAGLTRQLLAFSRREVAKPELVDLNRHVADMEKLLTRTLGERIALVSCPGQGLPPIEIDPVQLEQLIVNLVVNARDAMPEGGRLTLETAAVDLDPAAASGEGLAPGRHVELRVTDTGVGMPPEVLRRLFEPFFTTKARGQGTGMGLATVYGVVKQAGGSISARSQPSAGAVFRVLLPAAAPRPAAGAVAPDPAPGRGEVVLVVEDQDAVRRLTCRILRKCGYQVLAAGHGDEALAVAGRHERIDLLLSDVVMPGLSCQELTARLRERFPAVRVVFMSGYVDQTTLGIEVLSKPFTSAELLARLRSALDT